MTPSRLKLQSAAQSFCEAFATKKPLPVLMELFSTAETPTAVEYGLRRLTPFTGSIYEGLDGVRKYFETIGDLLSYEDMQFSDYVVDAEVLKVSVRGRATFTWQSTGKSWLETFTYTLEFDNLLNVKKYEVWADTGAAYLASRGELQ